MTLQVDVVIPVRDQLAVTQAILGQLGSAEQPGWERCWVLDNGSTDETPAFLADLAERDQRFGLIPAAGWTVYEMWGLGVDLARELGAEAVAVLNNDLVLAPGTIAQLTAAIEETGAWVAYPNYDRPLLLPVEELGVRETSGTYRHGGMSGSAFMLDVREGRVDWKPLVDPGFKFWYGDDDLAFTVEQQGGRQVRVSGLGIEHTGGATTALHPEMLRSVGDDQALCVRKWGR